MTDQQTPKGQSIAGYILSGLVILFLLFDAGLKLVSPETAIKYTPPILGWPLDVPTMTMLAILLLIPTLLYIWPRTAILGAILITGYLGGAIATHSGSAARCSATACSASTSA